MFSRSRSFIYGFKLPLQALRLIFSHKILLFWSLFPVILTALLYFYGIRHLQAAAMTALEHLLVQWGWNLESIWATLVQWTIKILLILFGALTFSFASSLIASPFNDFLAEKTEPLASPPLPRIPSPTLTYFLRTVLIDMGKTLAAAIAGIAAFLFSLIPIVNLVIFVLAFLLITLQYISYPQTRRGQGIREGVQFLCKNFYACVGFGAALSLCFAIPLLSIFVLPVAVVGGTLLFARAQSTELFRLK